MIVKCPSCQARFQLDRDKLVGKRVTLRCARCRAPFAVELPHTPTGRPSQNVRIMIAHSDPELCQMLRDIVQAAGFEGIIGHHGEEVLTAMDRRRPSVAVVDVALQGLYAFEVVDKIRRRPGLDKVKIILLSSVYNKAAYKRAPSSLYGADDYIEKHHIPDDLVMKINRLLVEAAPAEADAVEGPRDVLPTAQGVPESSDTRQAVNEKILSAEEQEVSAEDTPERQRAERLARIIVSDISLYYQERVDEGIQNGNWSELLAKEISEARHLFRERFPSPAIQNSKILEAAFLDFLEKRRQELGA